MVKPKKQNEAEKEAQEQKHQKELESTHTEYANRIEARIKNGEELTVKPFEEWVKKIKKTVDGIETEVLVSGESGETKRERFVRLLEARMTATLHDLDLIMNLSSPQYESNTKDHEKIVNVLRLKVLDIENSFKIQEKKPEGFKL